MNFGNVLLAGCGGTGTEVAKLLVYMKFKTITFVDYDQIKHTNLNRQFFYCENDFGKYKAKVLCEKIEELYIRNTLQKIQDKSYKNHNKISQSDLDIKNHNLLINTKKLDSLAINKYNAQKRLLEYKEKKVFDYIINKIENITNTSYDTIFCCLDNVSSRMTLNLFDFRILIDLGVEGNKCHVKKVVSNNQTSCLYCIKDLYTNERNMHVCTQRDINKLIDRNEVLKFLVTKYNEVEKVLQEFNKISRIKNYKKANVMEIENIMKNIIPSNCYTNSICASLAMLVLDKLNIDFIFYNGHRFTMINTQKKDDCIVCKNKVILQ